MLKEILPQAIGEVVGEAEERADAEAKKLQDELRIETEQKLNAQFDGFEHGGCAAPRRRPAQRCLANLRETMSEAESRIDEHPRDSPDEDLESARTRDRARSGTRLLDVVAAKTYGQLAEDDALKHSMAEKAIAELRKRMASVEAEGARATELAGVANQLAGLEDAHAKRSKNLLIRALRPRFS